MIDMKYVQGLFVFDGERAKYRNWRNRVRDHCGKRFPPWRELLDHARGEQSIIVWATVDKISQTYPNIPPRKAAAELWLFLSKWLGTTLYEHRKQLARGMSENGTPLC